MFDNIGGKIKAFAKAVCWIGIIFSIGFGIYLIYHEIYKEGVVWLIVGPLSSWIGTFVLYGFGELIESVDNIEYKIDQLVEPPKQNEGALSKLLNNNSVRQEEEKQGWKCQCGRVNPLFVGTCACGKNKDNKQVIKPATRRTITCPECGSIEDASHTQCYKCGAKLQSNR